MPRPLTWLSSLHDIRRQIGNSDRSHYERKDLEPIFHLQHRAMHQLMGLLPCTKIGRSLIVERQALLNFLERVHAADDPGAVIQEMRIAKEAPKKRKLRNLVQADMPPVTLENLPASLLLQPGEVSIRFIRMEDLVASLHGLAMLLDSEDGFEAFEKLYQPLEDTPEREASRAEQTDLARLEHDLAEMERQQRFHAGRISDRVRDVLAADPSRSSVCTADELVTA